jgi:hypothetical protein
MGTWTVADELRLSIRLGLKRGLALARGMRRALTEDEQNRVAEEITVQLRRGWKIEPNDVPIAPGMHSMIGRKAPDRTD